MRQAATPTNIVIKSNMRLAWVTLEKKKKIV